MSEELFEKYLQNALSEEEQRRLTEILAESEGKQAFVDFLQEWSLFGEVSREMMASGAVSRPRERVRPQTVSRPRAGGWWIAGLAASFLFVLGLILVTRAPETPPTTMTHVSAPRAISDSKPDLLPEPVPEKTSEPPPAPRKLVTPAKPRPEVPPVRSEDSSVSKKEPRTVPTPRKPAPARGATTRDHLDPHGP